MYCLYNYDSVRIGYRNSINYYDGQKFTTFSRISSRDNWISNRGTLDSTTYTELQKYWAECQSESVNTCYEPEKPLFDNKKQELGIFYGKERKIISFWEGDYNLPRCIREIIRISTSPTITANLVNSPPLLTYSYGGNDHEITFNNDRSFTAYSQTSSRGKKKWISNKGILDSITFGDLQKYWAECQDDSIKIYYKPQDPQFNDTWQEMNLHNGQKRKVITFCERDKNLPLCIREIIKMSTFSTITANLVNYPSFTKKNVMTYSYSNQFRGGRHGISYFDDRTFHAYSCQSSRAKEKCKSNDGTLDPTTFGELQKYWAECLNDSIKSSYEPDVVLLDEECSILTFHYGTETKTIRFFERDKNLPTCIQGIIRINGSPK